jgi:hypothetical protein
VSNHLKDEWRPIWYGFQPRWTMMHYGSFYLRDRHDWAGESVPGDARAERATA